MTDHLAAHTDESDRLALLHASKLLDAEVDPAFDALARLAAAQLACPMAAINLIDAHRVWSMSRVGIENRQFSREGSICGWTITQTGRLVVNDVQQDPDLTTWLGTSPSGPLCRAYIGMPLVVEGHALGTLCVMDHQVREWSHAEIQRLKDVAIATTSLVEAKIRAQRLRKMEARIRTASLAGSDWLWETNRRGQIEWVSPSLLQHTGVDPASEVGLMAGDIYTPRNDYTRESWDRFQQAIAKRQPFSEAIAERDTPRGRITVSISGQPVFTSQGQFMGYRGASRNVTRQIDIEKQARLSDLLLRQAIESFEASVMISDAQDMVVLSNSRWRTNVGSAFDPQNPHWPTTLKNLIKAGVYPQAMGQEAAYLQWRLGLKHTEDPHEVQFREKWLLVKDQILPDGGTVHFALDVTQSKRDELDLASKQKALKESEARLASVLRALPDVWMVLDAQGCYLDAQAEHPWFESSFASLQGQPFASDIAEPYQSALRQALEQVQRSGQATQAAFSRQDGAGVMRHFEARMSPMPNGMTLVLARDMTEQEVSAEKLRVSEELYRSVATTISDGLVILDLSGRLVAINPAASRILGIPVEQIPELADDSTLGIELLDPELHAALPLDQWPLTRTIKSGVRVSDEVHPIRRRDGAILWVRISSNLLRIGADGTPFAAMVTCRDLTEEQKALHALAESEERWKFALDGAGDGVWDWNTQTDQVFFSAHWRAMLGDEEMEFQGQIQDLLERIHPEDRAAFEQALAHYVQTGSGVFQAEFRMQHRQGHTIWVLSRGKITARDEHGQALRLVGTHSDITPIKRAEQALREKHAAETASRAKTQFLSRMSHEVRTPLNAVNGFAQLLKIQQEHSGLTDATQKSYVDHILRAGQHLMGIVNDVLDLQQVEAGVLTLKTEPIDLQAEVQACIQLLAPIADTRQVHLHSQLQAGVWVSADRQRLRQALMNVSSNAIKYNLAGGQVAFSVGMERDGTVSLTVADTGQGMSPQQLSRLFHPFERLGRETSNIEGTGLGLIITRSLIEAMGGQLSIRSQPGAGTQVTLLLPPASAPEAAAPATTPMSRTQLNTDMTDPTSTTPDTAIPARPLRVLYVEDNRINAMLFEEALRTYPELSLEIAEDGEMALSCAQDNTPDVLVLDAHLPGMTGFDVLRMLRKLPGLANTPAYMCSADAMPEDVEKAKQEGFAGYWTKPIDIMEVTSVLCKLAAEPRPDPS